MSVTTITMLNLAEAALLNQTKGAAQDLIDEIQKENPKAKILKTDVKVSDIQVEVFSYYSLFGCRSLKIKLTNVKDSNALYSKEYSINTIAKACNKLFSSSNNDVAKIAAGRVFERLQHYHEDLNKRLKDYSFIFRLIVKIRDYFFPPLELLDSAKAKFIEAENYIGLVITPEYFLSHKSC